MNHILLYKPPGLTPQQAIDAYRLSHPKYHNLKLGTAGRLDPMAEGLLIVMVGEENKNQSYYLGLDKTYEVELILGISTDSYDLLGMPRQTLSHVEKVDQAILNSSLAKLTGKILQPYPPYSAVRVKGKPLYWWARQGRLHEITIPSAERCIYNLDLISLNKIKIADLVPELTNRIEAVAGDFRQKEIMMAWNKQLGSIQAETVWNIAIQVNCSSGTFVRGIVHQIGQDQGCGAVTKGILRTKVGSWELADAERINT